MSVRFDVGVAVGRESGWSDCQILNPQQFFTASNRSIEHWAHPATSTPPPQPDSDPSRAPRRRAAARNAAPKPNGCAAVPAKTFSAAAAAGPIPDEFDAYKQWPNFTHPIRDQVRASACRLPRPALPARLISIYLYLYIYISISIYLHIYISIYIYNVI